MIAVTLARRRRNSSSHNLNRNSSSHASRELRAGGVDAVAEAPDANEAKAARRSRSSSRSSSSSSAALRHRKHHSSRMRSRAAARMAVVRESADGAGAGSVDAVVAVEMMAAAVELRPRHRSSPAASVVSQK